ncbi:MAG: YceI family protein [Comamonadaceae bacterium]|nr:YceI family protein [Comamonadaceae bacterium]
MYRIDAQQSLVTVRVYRGGRLARLGHDHVVASRAVEGLVLRARAPAEMRADLHMALESLTVDEPELRNAAAGLDTTPSAADIEGTRRNMLDKTLEAARYPYVTLALTHASGELPKPTLHVAITLHDVTRSYPIPVEIDAGDDRLRARGRFTLLQTDHGISPFSIFGGALEVQDRLDIEFDLQARRW